MRNFILCLGFLLIVSCKTTDKQHIVSPSAMENKGKNIGMVTHQYKNEGCRTIIIINKGNEKVLNLIPINTLDAKFDKDQLKISFDYLPLRIKNPEGCNKGIPAEISNICIE